MMNGLSSVKNLLRAMTLAMLPKPTLMYFSMTPLLIWGVLNLCRIPWIRSAFDGLVVSSLEDLGDAFCEDVISHFHQRPGRTGK